MRPATRSRFAQLARREVLLVLAVVCVSFLYLSRSLIGPSQSAWKPVTVLHETGAGAKPLDHTTISALRNPDALHASPPPGAMGGDDNEFQDYVRERSEHRGDDSDDIHVIFSQSCDQSSRIIQQTIIQQTATAVGQKGPITQLLSGCSDAQRAEVLREPTFYHNFQRYFTRNYMPHPEPGIDDWYMAYNKPFALRDWLRNVRPRNKFVALIDGDFAFFHRLEINTGRNVSEFYYGARAAATVNDTVRDGQALAQNWGMYGGVMWFKEPDKIKGICGEGATALPCAKVSLEDAKEYYEDTASPYILTMNDLDRMIDDYCHFTVLGRKMSDNWVVEMEAYTFATANHGIRHNKLHNYAISLPPWRDVDDEYWRHVDVIPDDQNPCDPATGVLRPGPELPPLYFFHWFHRYGREHYSFYKRDLPKGFAKCDGPLLKLPPMDEWKEASANADPRSRRNERRYVWAECTITKLVNQAALAFREKTCPNGFSTKADYVLTKAPSLLV
ncbi:hypothetical protein ATCC90586_001443 [Pythium insidiosum]|nr:hypothetical protein ATCC90586_001443 [Pythium insidiosum]